MIVRVRHVLLQHIVLPAIRATTSIMELVRLPALMAPMLIPPLNLVRHVLVNVNSVLVRRLIA